MKHNKKENTYQCYSAFKIGQNKLIKEKRTVYKVLSCVDLTWLYSGEKKGFVLTLEKVVLPKVNKQ